MTVEPLPPLSVANLMALAGQRSRQDCAVCAPLVCPGWESVPSTFDLDQLQPVGTLRGEDAELAPVMEHHPRGSHSWSADAPIALAFFPYNRCDVWVCGACARPFLRYTEYGGYYEDPRIRALDAALLDDTQP